MSCAHRPVPTLDADSRRPGATQCDVPCPVGDLYAIYAFYMLAKTSVGVVDVLLAFPFLVRKPRDWYRITTKY